ncbi:MAG TPA: 4-phosphoerythronate dehydrogenase [Pseudomonadaceae bacterium]|nr:4-phosphoerythronate dehydrogenase [Pseudomonadaceae bacterium]
MKILADENIALVHEAFSRFGELRTLPGRAISAAALQDVDALLVRSVTRVDEALLEGSPCRFVGTATSGSDHVDIPALLQRGISFADALGCNADSVVDYVLSALARLSLSSGEDWRKRSVGIVGCGAVGSRLAQRLLALGIQPLIHDPFLNLAESHPLVSGMTSLEQVLGQDIVSLHVPLTTTGPWPTFHMLNHESLCLLRPNAILINSARGGVVDNQALLERLQQDPSLSVVLDAWEGEPIINPALYARVRLGTPHIAGYSVRGKVQGTRMIQAAFCRTFGLEPDVALFSLDTRELAAPADSTLDEDRQFLDYLLRAYDIRTDHHQLGVSVGSAAAGPCFDALRRNYPLRHEFSQYRLRPDAGLSSRLEQALKAVGFAVGVGADAAQ